MSRTSLTFFGGVGEIGGNKILLRDRDTRVFLDFGLSFSKESQYFSGYLCPRTVNGAGDLFEFGLLPNLTGLYAKEALKNTKIRYAEPQIDGIFLSHAHMDHVGYLEFVDEEIPVHCGEGTRIIMRAMEESGRSDLGKHDYRPFRTGKKVRVGSLEIEPIHVDHSIPAAYGFIIHTSEGTVVYSGDLRTHGPMCMMTWEFAEKAGESDVRLMVSEGTRISPNESGKVQSETRVREKSNRVVAKSSKIVVVSFYSRDIDRFKTFYETAKRNDRRLVIPLKLAYLLHQLRSDPRLKIPDILKDKTIVLYKKRKKTGEFREGDYFPWERPFLEKAVDYNYVRRNQSSVIFNLDLTGFTELIDIHPSSGGEFIHSMSEPFSEEDLSPKVLPNWLEHFGLRYRQIHASGHCPSKELAHVIDKIHPKQLVPIHTEYPALFKAKFKKYPVRLVNRGEEIRLS